MSLRSVTPFVAFAAVQAAHGVVVIDNFTDGAYDSGNIYSGSVGANQTGSPSNIIGGRRDTLIQVTSNGLPGVSFVRVIIQGGTLAFQEGPLVNANLGLGYGIGTDLNANLSAEDRFRFTFLFNDLAPLQLQVAVFTTGGGTSSNSYNVPVISSGPVDFDVTFASLGGGANFADVDRIFFGFTPQTGGDFALGGINAVPEPASIVALGLALAVLARRGRK